MPLTPLRLPVPVAAIMMPQARSVLVAPGYWRPAAAPGRRPGARRGPGRAAPTVSPPRAAAAPVPVATQWQLEPRRTRGPGQVDQCTGRPAGEGPVTRQAPAAGPSPQLVGLLLFKLNLNF